ncbi:MAG: DNA ligase, partial [Deltaproteobacteria bacterium]
EPEIFSEKKKLKHPRSMLSIQKAYTHRALSLFVARVTRFASEMGEGKVCFRVTAKLDGVAGRDDGRLLVTRGDGFFGFDVTSAFDKGVVPIGGRGNGLGEIVISRSYFKTHLAGHFEHPRNLVVGIISSDKVNEMALSALADGAVHFVPYDKLPAWYGTGEALLQDIETIYRVLVDDIDYPVDGIVVQVVDERLKDYMGATANHYRWQIAYKKRGETGVTTVNSITWQVGRTGNVTPVLEVDPIRLSGATIQRVTAHHAGMVRKMSVGPGARIELIRSGEVIPKLEKVLSRAAYVEIPDKCPSCGTKLDWRGDFLHCPNGEFCRDQIVGRLYHWFRILGNADWFGVKTIERLVDGGLSHLSGIYAARIEDYLALGFGMVQSRNLYDAIQRSLNQPVEDWRFLAALGISGLGVGESRKLLACYRLDGLWDLGWKQVAEIKGFGEIKSRTIMGGLGERFESYCDMLSLGFQLLRTPRDVPPLAGQSAIAGKGVVFTGKMQSGTRTKMQALARRLGAKVQTRVSGATNLLVCGENVGPKKLENARSKGVQILTESEFINLIGDDAKV